jgi:hypothetical protein
MSPARRARPSSSVRHLARALWLNHVPARCYVAASVSYTAYFDASGKKQDPLVMYVSGFISTAQKWERFEKRWLALLDGYDIKSPFHTTDYVRGKKGSYSQFDNNDRRRDAFEKKATSIIADAVLQPFSFGMVLSGHRWMVENYELPFGCDEPYSFCALQSLYAVFRWVSKAKNPWDKFSFVYSDGDDDRGLFSNAAKKDVGIRPDFRPYGELVPFQAADILAWRHARLMKDVVKVASGGERPRREFFPEIFKKIPHGQSCGYYDGELLAAYCAKKGYPKKKKKAAP